MAPSRSTTIRKFAHGLAQAHDCAIDAAPDDGRTWSLRWHDGPTRNHVRESVDRELPEHADIIRLHRELSAEATVLGAIRAYTTGNIDTYSNIRPWNLRDAAQNLLQDVADPLAGATDRERALVAHLLDTTARTAGGFTYRDADNALDALVEHRGIGWLLTTTVPGANPTPLEILTAHYAREHADVFRTAGTPMPARAAWNAVLADPAPVPEAAQAGLALLPILRAELDAAEERLRAAATGA
ncbi:hypothetical protein [Kitasatospora sp. NPDC090091]|uniref:hypothetical protein n=1 Tax=Kitasatospora sp. NPDC090091 TaxID=3364081 RepID=UPI0038029105